MLFYRKKHRVRGNKTAPSAHRPIPVRHADFAFDGAAMSKYCWDDNAFSSAFILTFSALIPYGERFVIQSMRDYRDQIGDPQLRSEITSLIGQEAMHSRVHEAFNQVYQAKGLPMNRIGRVGKWYFEQHLPRLLPKPARLAVTCAIEHFTAMMADRAFNETDRMALVDDGARAFLVWHLIEEAEHKAVAFDVYQHAEGDYWLRVMAMVFIVAYTAVIFAWSVQAIMRTPGYSRGVKRDYQGFAYWFGLRGYFPTLSKQVLQYFRPDFHPNQIDTDRYGAVWYERLFGEGGELTPFIQKTVMPRLDPARAS